MSIAYSASNKAFKSYLNFLQFNFNTERHYIFPNNFNCLYG